jgi:hypothetical protein
MMSTTNNRIKNTTSSHKLLRPLRYLSGEVVYKTNYYHEYPQLKGSDYCTERSHLLSRSQIDKIRSQLQNNVNVHDDTFKAGVSDLLHDNEYGGGDVIQHLINNPIYGLYYGALYASHVMYDMSKTALEERYSDESNKSIFFTYFSNALTLSIISGNINMIKTCLKDVRKYYEGDHNKFKGIIDIDVAAVLGRKEIVKYFVEKNFVDKKRMRKLLMESARSGGEETFRYLLQVGAGQKIPEFTSAYFIKTLNDILKTKNIYISADVLDLLIEEYGATDYEAGLLQSVKINSIMSENLARQFIEKGAKQLDAALLTAARHRNVHVVELLILKGAVQLDSALNEAIGFCHHSKDVSSIISIVRILLRNGADVAKGMDLIIKNKDFDLLQTFVEHGGDIKSFIILYASSIEPSDKEILISLMKEANTHKYLSCDDYADVILSSRRDMIDKINHLTYRLNEAQHEAQHDDDDDEYDSDDYDNSMITLTRLGE